MPPRKRHSPLSVNDLISDHLTESEICILNNPPYVLTIPLDTLLPNSKHRTTCLPPRPQNPWILFRKDFEAKYRKHAPTISARTISSLASETWRKDEKNLKRFFQVLAKITVIIHQTTYPEYKFSPKKTGKEKKWVFKYDARSLQHEEIMDESAIDAIDAIDAEHLRMNGEEEVGEGEGTMIEAADKINIPRENKMINQESQESNAVAEFPDDPRIQQTLFPTPVLDPFSLYSPATTTSYLASPPSEICSTDLMPSGRPIHDMNGVWDRNVIYSPSLPLPSTQFSSSSYGTEHFDFPLYYPPETACVIDSSYPYLSAADSIVDCGTRICSNGSNSNGSSDHSNGNDNDNDNNSNPQSQIRLDLYQQPQLLEKQMGLHLDCSKQQQHDQCQPRNTCMEDNVNTVFYKTVNGRY